MESRYKPIIILKTESIHREIYVNLIFSFIQNYEESLAVDN